MATIANQLERRIGTVPQLNDLYLLEASLGPIESPYVFRFQIEAHAT